MFNVGDKVRIIGDTTVTGVSVGDIGEVIGIFADAVYVCNPGWCARTNRFPEIAGVICFRSKFWPQLEKIHQQTCYLAGPMRGYLHCNFPAFDEAEKRVKELYPDIQVINPAVLDREEGIDPAEVDADTFTPDFIRGIVKRDLDALLTLRAEQGDFICLLPGWEFSTGAGAEASVCTWLGIKAVQYPDFKIIEPGRAYSLVSI